MIYPILTYIFNCYIVPKMYILPTLCPMGTMKLSNLHPSPKIWHVISNTKIFIQLTHNPKMFKCSKCSKMFHNFPCHNSHVIIFHVRNFYVQMSSSSNFSQFKNFLVQMSSWWKNPIKLDVPKAECPKSWMSKKLNVP